MPPKSLQEIDLHALTRRQLTPSPAAWEDQVLYFLMLDRFSAGRERGCRDNLDQIVAEGETPPFTPEEAALWKPWSRSTI